LKVDGKPYAQEGSGKIFTRTFSSLESSSEFKWHRDEKRRVISVLSGNNWKFQFDDSVPFELFPGDIFIISADSWHRIIPGLSDLIIKIEED
jgi:quercetin dioxygenase-like cupin family protein